MTTTPITDEIYNAAFANASYWARRRLNKKLEKVIYRTLWHAETKYNKAGLYPTPRLPKDLENYVKNFVQINYAKGLANEK